MQMTLPALQPLFQRAALYSTLAGSLLLGGCATVMNPEPESCMGGKGFTIMGTGFHTKGFDKDCGEYQLDKINREADVSRAEILLKTKDDPVAQAAGMLIYDQLNPQGKKDLEARMAAQQSIIQTSTGCVRTREGNKVTLHCPAAPKPVAAPDSAASGPQ